MLPTLIIGTFVVSSALTMWLRRLAWSRSLIDIPNSRSSHVVPTPRGGGLAFVFVLLVAFLWLAWEGALSQRACWALFGSGLLVAAVGWLDDRGGVDPRWRLGVHFIAAIWALVWLGGLPHLFIFGKVIDFGWVGDGMAILYLVWLLNLYNFMDGIDGIAGIEAVTVCIGAAVLYNGPAEMEAQLVLLLIAAAVGGFLVWNFPRARIFMGDAGSGFLGMILGVLSLEMATVAPELFWAWIILLGAFIVDATVCLLRRLFRGERVHQAHCSHAYQRAAKRLGSHAPVSLAFGAVNAIWLLPVAWLVASGFVDGIVGVLLAYSPLIGIAIKFGAGQREMQ